MFKYEVPMQDIPAVRLGRWDGKVSYQLGGSTYINPLPDYSVLDEMKYEIDVDDPKRIQY